LEAPTDQSLKLKTYNELLEAGIKLGAKRNPSQSRASYLSYRAAWLAIVAAAGWSEDQFFQACYR
jgi:hypothetical protein